MLSLSFSYSRYLRMQDQITNADVTTPAAINTQLCEKVTPMMLSIANTNTTKSVNPLINEFFPIIIAYLLFS